jgi:hypothetical protein
MNNKITYYNNKLNLLEKIGIKDEKLINEIKEDILKIDSFENYYLKNFDEDDIKKKILGK